MAAAVQRVSDQLAPLVTALRAALNPTVSPAEEPRTPATPATPAESREAATHLIGLLAERDPGAADFVESHRAALGPLFGDGAWREFVTLVQGYGFENAQALLERAVKSSVVR